MSQIEPRPRTFLDQVRNMMSPIDHKTIAHSHSPFPNPHYPFPNPK
jgi:hypothetical protein